MTARTATEVELELYAQARRDLMRANVDLMDAASRARAEMDAAQAETDRVTGLFEDCIPPPAEQWGEGNEDFRLGWDTCRQKMVELLKRRRDVRST